RPVEVAVVDAGDLVARLVERDGVAIERGRRRGGGSEAVETADGGDGVEDDRTVGVEAEHVGPTPTPFPGMAQARGPRLTEGRGVGECARESAGARVGRQDTGGGPTARPEQSVAVLIELEGAGVTRIDLDGDDEDFRVALREGRRGEDDIAAVADTRIGLRE